MFNKLIDTICNIVSRLCRSGSSSVGAPDRIQFQMTLHEEDEENVDEKDQVPITDNATCYIQFRFRFSNVCRLSLHSAWFIRDRIKGTLSNI